MTTCLHLLLAFALLFIGYTYAGYPLLLAVLARVRRQPVRRVTGHQPTISIVVAAYNEAANLPGRVANLLEQDYPAERVEIILVSDGSTDGTADVMVKLASEHAPRVKALPLAQNGGKAVALNAGVAAATGELIVFADARQRFAPDVLARLAENFADPAVGSASGELMFTTDDPEVAARGATGEAGAGVAAQVGLYWKYEKWMRRNESELSSMLGATGAIYAIRRALYLPLPAGTLLDDFLTPMRIVLRGRRAIFDGRARAWDRPSEKAGQELKRKVRTLAGNYQAFAFEPALLLPWRNPATWLQLWSHKLFRLWVPFALVLAWLLPLILSMNQPLWLLFLLVETGFYALALWSWQRERTGRAMPGKLASFAYTFCVLNFAAAMGLMAWLRTPSGGSLWQKAYSPPPQA